MKKNLLQVLYDERVARDRLSDRQVARETGLSPTTIGRIRGGEPVDFETILVMARWLEVNPTSLINSLVPNTTNLQDRIALILEADPRMRGLFDQLLSDLENGKLDLQSVEEVLSYASYRLKSLHGGEVESSASGKVQS